MRLALLAVLAIGCRETATFDCETDAQCRRGPITGVCEPEGCAFADSTCPSGLRLDDPIGGTCVALPPPPPGCDQWHPHHFDPCALPVALGPLALAAGAYQFDTDTGTLYGGAATTPASVVIPQSNPAGDPVRVITVDSFTIEADATLAIVGSLPVIIASNTTIGVTTSIDVSSTLGRARPGAGADSTSCATSAGGLGNTATGGGGGGFAGRGGAGGDLLDVNDLVVSMGGGGGTAVANLPETIRGGCAGGTSAPAGAGAMPPSMATTVGRGGSGGGAIDLAARMSIAIDGLIVANGAGGAGSPLGAGCGAGGGGSGGYIALEAPAVRVGSLFANGGGGGGAADSMHFGGNGGAGTLALNAAPGGVSGGCGSPGGAGTGDKIKDAGNATAGYCATGGGGGGIGFIAVHSPAYTVVPGVISPSPIVTPD